MTDPKREALSLQPAPGIREITVETEGRDEVG